MRQRAALVILALAVCIAVAALGSAGVASGAQNSAQKCNVSDTGQDLGRDFCIDVATFSGITASDTSAPAGTDGKRYTWVEFSMTNTGGSTLTNPRIVASLTDFCEALQCASTTSQFVDFPANCTANAAKTTLTCTYANIPAANPDASTGATKVYFKTGNIPATSSRIDVAGTVKERANDSNPCQAGDPNCDTVATSIVNSYEPDPNNGVSFALNGKQIYLTTNDKNSSFAFKSKNVTPFRADFLTSFPVECGATPSPTCFYRTLTVTPTFTEPPPPSGTYNDGPVVFYGRVTDLPAGVNQNNLSAIHTYDDNTSTVIGDVPAERTTKGCTFQFNANQIPIPSICVKKQGQVFDVWVWDAKNGQIKWT